MGYGDLQWHTERRRVCDLVPYPHNPRQLSEKQAKALEESLRRFNLAEIPAINTDNTIVAGHMRLKLLAEMGRGDEMIDVRVPSRQLADQEVAEYCVRSNQNTGEWDFDILANDFNATDLLAWGFTPEDLKLTQDMPAEEGKGGGCTKAEVECPKCGHRFVPGGNIDK